MAAARERTKGARDALGRQAKIVAVRVHQVRVLRDELLASRGSSRRASEEGRPRLAQRQERADAEEIDALQQVSAELAAKIRAAQAHSTVRGRRRPQA